MTKEKPLSVIEAELYKILADKTLSFGLRFKFKESFPVVGVGKIPKHFCNGVFILVWHNFRSDCPIQTSEMRNIEIGVSPRHGKKSLVIGLGCEVGKSEFTDNAEIIGHEPTLNDVLLKIADLSFCCDVRVYDNGHTMIEYKEGGKWVGSGLDYDITTSFDSQTQDTKRKLHSLLCKS